MRKYGVFFLFLSGFWVWAGEPVCTKNFISLRKAPAEKAAISWKVARYMPFLRVEKKSGWSKLQDLEGEEHWARNSDLSSQLRCVVVKTNVATLRKQPNLSAPPADLKTVDRYTPFKRVGIDREWVMVEDETGHQAWIHESNIWKPVNVQSISF